MEMSYMLVMDVDVCGVFFPFSFVNLTCFSNQSNSQFTPNYVPINSLIDFG